MLQNNEHSVRLKFMSFQTYVGGCAQTQKADRKSPGSDITAELFPQSAYATVRLPPYTWNLTFIHSFTRLYVLTFIASASGYLFL